MTGHGVGEAPLGNGRILIEVRAVNHRYLDVRQRLPLELAEHSAAVEERVRGALRRGRVDVLGRLVGEIAGPPMLDKARARAAFEQLCELRDELRPGEAVPLSLLASLPDLFSSQQALDHGAVREAVLEATAAACDQVWRMREREGRAIAEDVGGHLDAVAQRLTRVRARAPATVEAYRARLHARIERLLAGAQITLDPGRLEHEVALFADRADIAEEIARLQSHIGQMRDLLDAGEPSAGKRLDFLLQEMSREVNTIGSKSSDADLAGHVVEMKAAISRMREQAQNVL